MVSNQLMTVQKIGGRKTKTRRKRNCSNRAKLNSQGFNVRSGTRVYVGKATSFKPEPRKALVEMVKEMFRIDSDIKKMNKHFKEITITYQKTNNLAGFWNPTKRLIAIIDDGIQTVTEFRSTLVHEIKGHTFFHFALKWRRQELIAFCKLANKLSPVSTYVKANEEKWRSWNDDNEELKRIDAKWDEQKKIYGTYDVPISISEEMQKQYDDLELRQKENGHEFMTRYANEQHSAIAEIVAGFGGHKTLLNEKDVNELIKLYEVLHY